MQTDMQTQQKRYSTVFSSLKQQGQTGLIPFTLLGWPNEETSYKLIQSMIDAGASALELGFAFSDPMADGPVIQKASVDVLSSGFGVQDGLSLLKKVRAYNADIPIGLLVYYNIVLAYGIENWFKTLANIGVDAVMIVDLPLESLAEIQTAAKQFGVELVLMISPLTSKARIAEIAAYAPAFLYVVSRLGITGTHTNYDAQLQSLLGDIRSQTDLPACVGFGISKPEHVRQMREQGADGVIIGSAVIHVVNEAITAKQTPETALKNYLTEMLTACKA